MGNGSNLKAKKEQLLVISHELAAVSMLTLRPEDKSSIVGGPCTFFIPFFFF
jgi:hypothetical protein